MPGLILLPHGAVEPRRAEPFEAVAAGDQPTVNEALTRPPVGDVA